MVEQPTAPICEVFTSAQGEGLLVGVRQLFIRFRGCDLDCLYCDTPQARSTEGPCQVEDAPGSNCFTQRENPFPVVDLLAIAQRLIRANRHAPHCWPRGCATSASAFTWRQRATCLKRWSRSYLRLIG